MGVLDPLEHYGLWMESLEIHREALREFHRRGKVILEPACPVRPFDEKILAMEKNLFSTLFILLMKPMGLSPEKIRFYALINQCIRALVTGCDNILDDEYKEVIPFDLPGEGIRFRSVLMIMTADRILADLAVEKLAEGLITSEQASILSSSLLASLIPSGLEEHEEESRQSARDVADPDRMLGDILYRKTGQLFEAPFRVVEAMGDLDHKKAEEIYRALSDFGTGCQLLDEIRDVEEDLAARGHNMVVSLAYHGKNSREKEQVISTLDGSVSPGETGSSLFRAKLACFKFSLDYFRRSVGEFSTLIPGFGKGEITALARFVRKIILKNDDFEEDMKL